ncbi:hypothetical protein COOONC_11068 [Cooperia oncophora]
MEAICDMKKAESLKYEMETARPPPSQDKSSENTDPHPIQPRIARSVLYIDATQEIDTGNDQMVSPNPLKGRKSHMRGPSQDGFIKTPAARTPATAVEPEHLPRAPKGHHVEELQEMEDILNEMTMPQTLR